MRRLETQIDPYANDPGRWGASLATHAELLVACLDATQPHSIVEVGAYAGDVTRILLDWARGSKARVTAIDPDPNENLVALAAERSELELIRQPSLDALRGLPSPDLAIIDGDHNYYTVSEELRLIAEAELPLLIFHDVGWPHARRDNYYSPDLIPEQHRQPLVEAAGLFPGEPGIRPGGLPYRWAAAREGGPGNGVLTAIEDFVDGRDDLRLAVVPAFFGFGALWSVNAPWADALAEILDPWDRNPLLERLEGSRTLHLASSHYHLTEANALRERVARQEAVLRRLLESSAFSLADRLSRLRVRMGIAVGQSAVSKDEIRRALSD